MTDREGYLQAPVVELSPTLGAGSSPDFRTILGSECSYVFHSLRRLGVHERDLEDVAHDVFLAIHKKLGDYDPARPLRPWIFAFAFRFAADYRKLARHRREKLADRDDAIEATDVGPSVDDRIDAARDRQLVLEALEALDLDKRAVFVMHEIDGNAMPAIATALGIPVNTAYSRLRLAREQFAASVKRLRSRAESDTRARRTREAR
jgi:RNA polymerase sigma-70 factor (ECF subfamily)